MLARLHQLRRWAGVDRPVLYMATGQAWSLFSGPITILMVTQYFTPEMQGYFYTFSSVLGLQAFLELGFSQCIIQFASHEFAHLQFQPDRSLVGDPHARARLLSLGRLSLKWYAIMGLLAFIGLGFGGHWFFLLKPESGVSWIWPWWCLCLTTGLSLCLQPFGALLEGCNQMAFVYGLRTLSRIITGLVLWGAVFGGAKLFSGSIMTFTMITMTATAYAWWWRGLLLELWHAEKLESISWRREIWPFQWRIAISCISGYFIFNLLVPVLFYFHGSVEAGKMGVTMTLVGSLNVLAQAWTVSKGPRYGILVSQRKFAELDRLFYRSTAQAVAICMLGGVALVLGLVVVQKNFVSWGSRFLPPGTACLLVVATVANQFIVGQAIYLRAHKQEPFMIVSLVNGLLTGLLVIGLGRPFATWGVASAYATVQVFVLLIATVVWSRCRREWHQSETLTQI